MQHLVDALEADGLIDIVDNVLGELGRNQSLFARWEANLAWTSTTCAGLAAFDDGSDVAAGGRVSINKYLSAEDRRDTLLHEVAHVIAEHIRPGTSHGSLWVKICKALGHSGEMYASDAVSDLIATRAMKDGHLKAVAQCSDCGFPIVRARVSRKDWSNYRHRGCGGRFENLGNQGPR